jgi:predicted enzyme related to lactoylglutathione lyase
VFKEVRVKNPVLSTGIRALAVIAALAFASRSPAENLPALNTPSTDQRFAGKFIWADLFTADPSGAEQFYTGLFGWSSRTIERDTASGIHTYRVLSHDDRPIAGIAWRPLKPADEVRGQWVGFVSVPDVPLALAAATSRGAAIVSRAKDLPDRGSQAIISDPEGAVLGILRSSSGDPGEYLSAPGDWIWSELFSRDPRASSSFYHGVVGYEVVQDPRSDQPKNAVLVSGGYSRASVRPVSDRPKAHPAWLLFVRVENVKEAVAKAVALGGRVIVAPSDSPTEHWRAVIADPTGAHIGLVELLAPEESEDPK